MAAGSRNTPSVRTDMMELNAVVISAAGTTRLVLRTRRALGSRFWTLMCEFGLAAWLGLEADEPNVPAVLLADFADAFFTEFD